MVFRIQFRESAAPDAAEHEAVVIADSEDDAYDKFGAFFLRSGINMQVVTHCTELRDNAAWPDVFPIK